MATLVRWEPFREMATLHNEMSRFLHAFEGNGRTTQTWVPAVDVWETENELVYSIDLPGIPKEKVSVEVEDSTLAVRAERERTDEVSNERFYRFERRFGMFERTIGLPQGVSEEDIKADFRDGVLEVHVPKPAQAKPRRIEIGADDHAAIEGSATPQS